MKFTFTQHKTDEIGYSTCCGHCLVRSALCTYVYYNETQEQCVLYALLLVCKRDETSTLHLICSVLLCIT